jgi:2-oxoglutarate dehydrogenase E2 component (dihydrolipoamide succinyltransferase)
MAALDVLAPENEEGTKATILKWCKSAGDRILKDEPLLELETDKVTVEIPSPASGELVEILKQPNEEVLPGQLLARVRIDAAPGSSSEAAGGADGAARVEETAGGASAARAEGAGVAVPGAAVSGVAVSGVEAPGASAAPSADDGRGRLSPAVRRLLRENALRADDIPGSGRDGRITAQDVARRLTAKPPSTRVLHTPIRRRVAEHMVRSLGASPHVTTLFEADLTRVQAHRSRHAAEYERRGARLTLTAYFVAACARALAANPPVNATYHEDALELHSDANIGVGTALGNEGLIVPVIHAAQNLDLPAIAGELGRVVAAARAGKLTPQDVRGGTFTISNHGVSGSLLAAPIVINQPQVAILGVGKVERRVCVIESGGAESIGIRTLCYLTLTIDHRALDAFQANAFLSHVVASLEQWGED